MSRGESKVRTKTRAMLHRWPVLAMNLDSWARAVGKSGHITRTGNPCESVAVTAEKDGARWVVAVRGEPVEFRQNGNAYASRFRDWFLELPKPEKPKPKDPEPEGEP